MIALGDIDLMHEIQLGEFGVVTRWNGGGHVRRLYSAKVHDRQSEMTVALYQGENAEEVSSFSSKQCPRPYKIISESMVFVGMAS